MKADYKDITSRINEEPKWYDEHGVPRYDDIDPYLAPNIYADEVVFMIIACQHCKKRFVVEISYSPMDPDANNGSPFTERLENLDKYRYVPLSYKDPPRHDCIGDTENSEIIKIIELWERDERSEWILNEKWSGYEFNRYMTDTS